MRHAVIFLIAALLAVTCRQKPAKDVVLAEEQLEGVTTQFNEKALLSDYGFFDGELKDLRPSANVYPYQINSPLFSDYAFKERFIRLPAGGQMRYDAHETFTFPNGSVLIKNFFYPLDAGKPAGSRRLLETRLLLFDSGRWRALNYVWDNDQKNAQLDLAGRTIGVNWMREGGAVSINYSVPSVNQCKSCHLKGNEIMPIGPSARQLNLAADGENQLQHWKTLGVLVRVPDLNSLPRLANYDDASLPIDSRARAWLEINCAHCHRPDGQAKNSGLHLSADVTLASALGVGKAPVAAGKGTGGRRFSIVPGNPDASIMTYRIESTDPAEMMPEIGRTLVHEEGVKLVREWIAGMEK